MHLRSMILLIAVCLTIFPARAQSVDSDRGRFPMTELPGPWRFHTGDDPSWSGTNFDDSSWPQMIAGRSWSQQGYSNYGGVAWYRLRVDLPPQPGRLALDLPYVESSCEVFANGRLIGHVGALPPNPGVYVQYNSVFSIPPDVSSTARPLEIAVRVWLKPAFASSRSGGLLMIPRLGNVAEIDEWRQLQIHHRFWRSAARAADVAINIFTALAGISLFLLRRREREYLWWGASQAFWAAFAGISLGANFFTTHYISAIIASVSTETLAYYLQFVFYLLFLHQRRGRLFWIAVVSMLASRILDLALAFGMAPGAAIPVLGSAFGMLTQACIVGILWMGARRQEKDAAILLIPNCVMLACNVLETLASPSQFSAQSWAISVRQFLNQAITWPFNVSAFQLVGDLEMLAVLVILVRRYARSRQDEERLESELEAARAVQQVLIPNEVPAIPGFAVETVYQPASQVGGDFFQIIPIAAGGALIAIGDVSGKGMPAAMTVSLLVGTLRTLAHYTQSPGEILTAMNRRMFARSYGGFTTCLVLRLDAGGDLTIANAGHIAPYLQGSEIEIENGLPLGLAESATYAEKCVRLLPHAQLTLVTDGVVEARKANGELLGFERTRELSVRPAHDVALAAQTFGQEDDITVLTLSMAPSAVA